MKTRVLLFSTLRERLQKSEMELEIPEGTSVQAVLELLLGREGAASWENSILFAINQNYCGPQTRLNDGDELILMPPVSGG